MCDGFLLNNQLCHAATFNTFIDKNHDHAAKVKVPDFYSLNKLNMQSKINF